MKLSLLVLRCENLENSKKFYEGLGLIFRREKHGKGPEHYSAEYDGVVFELYPVKEGLSMDNTRLGFKLAHLEQVIETVNIVSQYEFNNRTIYVVVDPPVLIAFTTLFPVNFIHLRCE